MSGTLGLAVLVAVCLPHARRAPQTPREGSRFGMSVAALDDLDGDHIPEIAVGAPCWVPWNGQRSAYQGEVLVLAGADRHVLRAIQGDPALEGFGEELASVGDADRDGARDLRVLHASWSELARRESWLVSARTGERLRASAPEATEPRMQAGLHDGEHLASAEAGDRDGDGEIDNWLARTSDVLGAGEVELRSSKTGERLLRLTVPEEAATSSFGRALLALPNLDGDGVTDLAVAAPDDPFRSIVRAYPGLRGVPLWECRRIEGEIGRVGASLASYPDVDADGVPEILVGSCDYLWHGAIFREGSVRLLSGKSGRTLWCVREDEVPELGPPEAIEPDTREGVQFGYAVVTLDDVDGLGRRDFAVSAPLQPTRNGDMQGVVLVFSSERRELVRALYGPPASFRFGARLAYAGDLDGDGHGELLAGMDDGDLDGIRKTSVLSPHTGRVLRVLSDRSRRFAPVGDIDADGACDLAMARGQHLELLSGRDGKVLREMTIPEQDPWIEPLTARDGGPRPDLLIREADDNCRARLLLGLPEPRTVEIELPFGRDDHARMRDWRASRAGDVDGDGAEDLWISRGDLQYQERVESALVALETGRVFRVEPRLEVGAWAHTPVADLDGDGIVDHAVVLPRNIFRHGLEVRSGRDDKLLWKCRDRVLETHQPANSLTLLDDEDGDGIPELLVGGCDPDLGHGVVDPAEAIGIFS